ncbi:MAG: hypothetical protein WC007_15040 [Pelobacteraceae bacterium]
MSETYRKAAGDKAHANSFERSYIDQKGRKKDCEEYLSSGTWPSAWPEPKLIKQKSSQVSIHPATLPTVAAATEYQEMLFNTTAPVPDDLPVKESLPVNAVEPEPVNTPLPVKEPLPLVVISTAPAMRFSTFNHKKHSKAIPLILNTDIFITMLATHHVRPSKDGKLFAPAAFNGSRGNNNFISASGICIDCDHGKPTIKGVLELFPDALAAFYTTHSNTPESPRFRIVLPLSRSVNAGEHAVLVLGVKSIITPELMDCIDQSCFERARSHYLPSCPPEYESLAIAGHQEGQPLDVEYFLSLGNAVDIPASVKRPPAAKAALVKPPLPAEMADTSTHDEPVNEKKSSPVRWFAQIKPYELRTDAWRSLSKTASDIVIICRAKDGRERHDKTRKSTGVITFTFPVNEAETQFRITRPTFIAGMKQVIERGFIEKVRSGNYGSNTPALYRLSDKWESWQQPERDNTNIIKARSMRGNSTG